MTNKKTSARKNNNQMDKVVTLYDYSRRTLSHLNTHTHTHTHISRARAPVRFQSFSAYIFPSLSLSFCRASGGEFNKKGDTTPKKENTEKKNHCDGGEENDDSSARSSTFFFVFFFVGREKTRIRFFLPRVRRARFIGASREARAATRFFFL
jgi:hypothetical protein